MKKEIEIIVKGDFIFFVDRLDEEKYYCISRDVFKEKENISILKLVFKLEREPYDVPDDITIKAFPLGKAYSKQNVDYYDFITKPSTEIDFKINRIKWILSKVTR